MSDYLDNLAVITSGAGNDLLIQPRLPSLYESVPPTPDVAVPASPLAQPEGESQRAAANTSPTISVPSMRFPDATSRTALMSRQQEQDAPVPVEKDPRSARSAGSVILPAAAGTEAAAIQHPDSTSSETDGAARNEELQRDAVPPQARVTQAMEHPSALLPDHIHVTERRAPEQEPGGAPDFPERDEGNSPESGASAVERELTTPDERPGLLRNASRSRVFTQGASLSTETVLEPGKAAQAALEGTPERGTVFPNLSPRPSLQLQESAVFSTPVKARQSTADAASARAEREQPPDVRISIGRVEVRAIMPAVPVEKAAPPKPRMSLDEYLRQQGEVKR